MTAPGSPTADTLSPQADPAAILAVLPVRGGVLPMGAAEAVAEADGACWLVGDGCREALDELVGIVVAVRVVELAPAFAAGRWAELLAPSLPTGCHVLLPHGPDGRDLAPHLAAVLDRPLVAGATMLEGDQAVVARQGGLAMETLALDHPVVATLQPGVRHPPIPNPALRPSIDDAPLAVGGVGTGQAVANGSSSPGGVELIEILPADPATMDLSESRRIVAGGAGLGSPGAFEHLEAVGPLLGASVGATRVVTDWGWISADRQIGTTGVTVDPELYIAVGISGAVQHTAGLGDPDHVIVVNTDGSCPMMDLADLALVCDGPSFVAELVSRLERLAPAGSADATVGD